jgi:hypothetical protein
MLWLVCLCDTDLGGRDGESIECNFVTVVGVTLIKIPP